MVKRKQNEPIQANRGGRHKQAMRSNGKMTRGGGLGERGVISIDTTIKQTDEKEHLARCSRMRRWQGSNCRAPHHQTNGEAGGRAVNVRVLVWTRRQQKKKPIKALRDDVIANRNMQTGCRTTG